MGIRTNALALIASAVIGGCTVGPNFTEPNLLSPSTWFGGHRPDAAATAESLPVQAPVDPEWWAGFHDPILTDLVRRAARDNLDVRTAEARLAQSRAQRGVAASNLLPQVNANSSYTREQLSQKGAISLLSGGGSQATQSNGLGNRQGGIPATQNIPAFDLFQGGFDASWELDLWGRVRRQVESADAVVESSTEARHAMVLSTIAEVARDYLQLRGVQANMRITRANLATARETTGLTRSLAAAGIATDLDVAQAEAQAEQTAAAVPQFEQQEAQAINQIGLLLALPPHSLQDLLLPQQAVPPLPPVVPVGLPSELAHRRPDIRQAEAILHAATADVGAAEADYYPKVTLSGSFALQATQFHNLGSWDAKTFGLGPSVTLPIFDGARIRRTVDLRKAQQQEAAIAYRRTVLQAFTEVDNALIAYSREQVRHDHLVFQVVLSDRALAFAQNRFRQGLADYLVVLTAQRTALQAEQQMADSTATLTTNLVSLYKALGGGWEVEGP